MKRSEMINAIAYYIKYTQHLDMSVHGNSNYEQLAKELLQLIENKGMIPPKNPDYEQEGIMEDLACYYEWEE